MDAYHARRVYARGEPVDMLGEALFFVLRSLTSRRPRTLSGLSTLMDKQIPELATTPGISDDEVVMKVMPKEIVEGEFAAVADVAAGIRLTVLGAYNLNWRPGPWVTYLQ